MGCQEADQDWLNFGICPEPFLILPLLGFLYSGYLPNHSLKQVSPCKIIVAMHRGKGKGLIPVSFRTLFLPDEILAGHSPHLQAWGSSSPSVLRTLLNRKVAHRPSAGTLPFVILFRESNAQPV